MLCPAHKNAVHKPELWTEMEKGVNSNKFLNDHFKIMENFIFPVLLKAPKIFKFWGLMDFFFEVHVCHKPIEVYSVVCNKTKPLQEIKYLITFFEQSWNWNDVFVRHLKI